MGRVSRRYPMPLRLAWDSLWPTRASSGSRYMQPHHQAVPGGAAASRQVVVHHTEVVEGDMGELRAAGALTHGPDAGRRRGQALVHPE